MNYNKIQKKTKKGPKRNQNQTIKNECKKRMWLNVHNVRHAHAHKRMSTSKYGSYIQYKCTHSHTHKFVCHGCDSMSRGKVRKRKRGDRRILLAKVQCEISFTHKNTPLWLMLNN